MTPAPYRYERKGRSWSTLLAALAVWLFTIIAWAMWDISVWVAAALLVFTLPALWDVWSGNTAGAELTPDMLLWYSGRRDGEVALHEIDHVRLVTRLDLTVRAAIVLKSGRKLRLPAEATPPPDPFEEALAAVGLKSQRHHFTFL